MTTTPFFQGLVNSYRGVRNTLPPLTSNGQSMMQGRRVVLREQPVPYAAAHRILQQSQLLVSHLEIDQCAIDCPTLSLLIHNSCLSLKQLTLDGDYCFHDLENCLELTELTICNSSILDTALIPVLENNPSIQLLDLHNCIHLMSSFDKIASLEKVVKLNLSGTYVDDQQMEKILEKHGASLTHLDLSTCPMLTRKTLTLIVNHCSQLQELYLHFNPDIIETGRPLLTSPDSKIFSRITERNRNLRIMTHGILDDDDLNTSWEFPLPSS